MDLLRSLRGFDACRFFSRVPSNLRNSHYIPSSKYDYRSEQALEYRYYGHAAHLSLLRIAS